MIQDKEMEKNRRSIQGFGENLKASIITQD